MFISKNQLLRKVIENGLVDKTKPRNRLAIFLKLNDLIKHMRRNQQFENELEHRAHEFLKRGPLLIKARSRFTSTVGYEIET